MKENRGVYITGGSTVSGPVAAGKGARATQFTQTNVLGQIDELLRSIEDEASSLDPEAAADVADDVRRVRDEVHHRRPDAESIRRVLTRLAATVGSAATLLAKIDQVRDLITQLVR